MDAEVAILSGVGKVVLDVRRGDGAKRNGNERILPRLNLGEEFEDA